MNTPQESERRYHVTINMGGKREYHTKHTYTREQAEEISEIAAESARVAAGGNSHIVSAPVQVVEE